MKRTLVIFPVGGPGVPGWFVNYISLTAGRTNGPATHCAVLIVGEVLPHGGAELEVLPTDTIRSALARGNFSRAASPAGHPVSRAEVTSLLSPRGVPAEKPTLWSRVKRFFRRVNK